MLRPPTAHRFLWIALPAMLAAQDQQPNRPQRPVVRASGEATVAVKPDRAQIDIGVVTQASSADGAASQNASQTSAVVNKLKSLIGSAGSLQTINYSLNPNFSYPPNSSPILKGYVATNTVQVTVDDLTLLGKAIDGATQAGSNNVNAIRFQLKDDQAARTEALLQATTKAKANAQAMAQALGVHVVGVVSAEANESGTQPPTPMPMMAKAMAAPTPVEAGTINVQASVTVTLEVGP